MCCLTIIKKVQMYWYKFVQSVPQQQHCKSSHLLIQYFTFKNFPQELSTYKQIKICGQEQYHCCIIIIVNYWKPPKYIFLRNWFNYSTSHKGMKINHLKGKGRQMAISVFPQEDVHDMLLNVESTEQHVLYDPNYLKVNFYEVVFKKGRI